MKKMELRYNYKHDGSEDQKLITKNSLLNGLFASITNMVPDKTEAISLQVYRMSHQIIMKAFHNLVQNMLSELNERDCVFGIEFLWKSIDTKDLWSRLKKSNVYEYLDKLSEVLNSDGQGDFTTEMYFVNQDYIHFRRSL